MAIEESILTSVKNYLGAEDVDEHFDGPIIDSINSIMLDLQQIGVGPEEGFMIEGSDETWEDFIGIDSRLQAVKSFIFLKTKLLFDPPQSSALIESMNRQIDKIEWRLNVVVDPGKEENDE